MGQEKDSGRDFTVAERPGGPLGCHLAADIIRSPCHVQQPFRTARKEQQPSGLSYWDASGVHKGRSHRSTGGKHTCVFFWAVGRGSVLETGIRLGEVP